MKNQMLFAGSFKPSFLSLSLFLIPFFLLTSQQEKSSNKEADSLRNVLKQSNDGLKKAEASYKLSINYKNTDPQQALEYAKECLKQSQSVQDHQWTTTAYHQLGLMYLANGEAEAAGKNYEEALAYELKIKPRDEKKLAWVYYNMGTYFKRISNYKEALAYYNKSLDMEYKIGNKERQASCLLNISAMYQYLGEVDMAITYIDRGYKIAKSINDTSTIESFLGNYGLVYEVKGDYAKALEYHQQSLEYVGKETYDAAYVYANMGNIYYYQGQISQTISLYEKAIEIFEKTHHENERAMTLLNLGVILADQRIFDKAIIYYERALGFFKKSGNKDHLSTVYLNMGSAYEKTGKLDLAMQSFRDGLNISLETENKNNIGVAYQNIGIIYELKGKYLLAVENLDRSLKVFSELGDERYIAETYASLGGLYIKTKNYEKAKRFLEDGLAKSEKVGIIETQEKIYAHLVELYSMKNDNGRSLLYHKKHLEIVDSLRKVENYKTVKDLQTRYEVREKEDSLKLQKEEILHQEELNKKKDAVNRQKNVLLGITLTSLLVSIVLGTNTFVNYKKKQKINSQLIEQKNTIEQKNSENELLLGEIHHRVKNNLQVISSLLSLQERNIENESVKSAILEGKERVKSMELVHKMLYQENKFSGIEMNDYTNKLLHGLIDSFGIDKSQVELQTKFKPIVLDVDTAIPLGLILNELIINSLKHVYKNTEKLILKIEIQEKNAELFVEVGDNGRGKIADVETSASFGLKIIKALIKQLNGMMEIKEVGGLSYLIVLKNYKLIT